MKSRPQKAHALHASLGPSERDKDCGGTAAQPRSQELFALTLCIVSESGRHACCRRGIENAFARWMRDFTVVMRLTLSPVVSLPFSDNAATHDADDTGSAKHQQQLRNLSPHVRAAWDQLADASYGRWCGPSTGGYNNCCSGQPCLACDESTIADEQLLPSAACLAACPPQDALDRACAIHDTCLKKAVVKRNRPSDSQACSALSNNFCGCDGQLVRNVEVRSESCNAKNRYGRIGEFPRPLLLPPLLRWWAQP